MTDAALAWNPEQPHNHLPALPPAHELETRAVLKACIEARAALAELKQAAELIPNQAMLINTIPLLEAKFRTNLARQFPTRQQERILDVSLDQARLEAMPVHEYVDLYVI